MWLAIGAPDLMQRLSRLPPVPNVTLLDRRKPKSLSWPHANTTFTQQTYIRWCCIDLSNAPELVPQESPESVPDQVEKNAQQDGTQKTVAAEQPRLPEIQRIVFDEHAPKRKSRRAGDNFAQVLRERLKQGSQYGQHPEDSFLVTVS